jgi:hypothetical protein
VKIGLRAFPRVRGAALLLLAAVVTQAAPAALLLEGSRAAAHGLSVDLADTGLYADLATQTLADGVLPYEPQYPLWTDGAAKRRWIRLPPGASIDATDPDRFVFPIGTRLWKEFAFEQRVETRFLERLADGTWRFATYRWSEDGKSAVLAPERGVPAAAESAPGVPFDIPSRVDCLACHAAGPNTVLGFTALQLSSDRDPLAPHAVPPSADSVDLDDLVRRGLVVNLPERFVEEPPRIEASSPRERAVLGYLSANCGMCHSSTDALAGLGLDLSYSLAPRAARPAIATTVDRPSRFRWPSDCSPLRIATSAPEASVLSRRMASRQQLSQMPPLGTHLRDDDALALVTAWIREDLSPARPAGPIPSNLHARNKN